MSSEKEKARSRKYYEQHKEEKEAYNKEWYQRNKEHQKARSKENYEQNREQKQASVKKYYEKNKEQKLAYLNDYRKRKGEQRRAWARTHYQKNKDRIKGAMEARATRYKRMAVDLLGGKCQVCGYNKCLRALDFHHKDPKEKEVTVSTVMHRRSWERIYKEVKKCTLLCCRCHREVHAGLISFS